MQHALNQEQRMIVSSARELAQTEFSDDFIEYEGEIAWDRLQTLAEHGFHGINISEEYGGGGLTEFEAVLVTEVIGRIDPITARRTYSQSMGTPRAVEMFGSEHIKNKYLPAVTSGEAWIAIAISEPGAGSDVASMKTTVEEEDGMLHLNGEKIWVSEFPEADAIVVWAKFPDEGIGSVIIEPDSAGVEVNEHYTNMHDGVQTHFFLEDVHVPEENVLVRGSEALKEQLKALNWERLGNSVISNATALCAFDMAIDYAKEREQFGQPISEFQGIQWKLADMATKLQASRYFVYQVALNAVERGRVPDRMEVSMAKHFSADMVEEVVSEALQIHGASGYMQGHPIEYLYRRARSRRLGGGTSETQKNTISKVLLDGEGLPHLG